MLLLSMLLMRAVLCAPLVLPGMSHNPLAHESGAGGSNPSHLLAPADAHDDADAASAEPTTQPSGTAAAATTQRADQKTIIDTFASTRLGQLAQGKKKVTLDEMKDPAFWIDTIRDLVIAVVSFVPRLIVSAVFLLVFWGVYRGIRRIALASMSRAHVDESVRELMGKLIKWCVMGFGLVIACNQVGIPIVAMLTGFSIIGLAVGFAAQETLANFIASVVIFWDKPFKVGDIIQVDGTGGQVQRVTFRSTRLLTGDGEVLVLPNTAMLAHKLTNVSANPTLRVRVPIGIAYKESIDAARAALMPLMTEDERVLKDPAPDVIVTACADSSVNLEMRFWIEDEMIHRVLYTEILEKAKKALDTAGICIPFPHLQLLVEETPATRNLRLAGQGPAESSDQPAPLAA
jgi:small conductance mechanosensitive channel